IASQNESGPRSGVAPLQFRQQRNGLMNFTGPSKQVLDFAQRFATRQVRMDHEKDSYEQQNL
ncbi:MAG: hypothetical protein ACERK9_14270, partial [Deltaproteobacteria bacterium]